MFKMNGLSLEKKAEVSNQSTEESTLVMEERILTKGKKSVAITFDDGPSRYTLKVKEIMDENINILKHTESINEAVEIASKYDLLAIPVVDNNEVLIGVVNTHDLIDEVLYPMWKKKNK